MLTIQLLGKFSVALDGRPVELPLRAAQSLLAYLVLTAGTAHRREQLAGLLWPDADEATAKGNLRHILWRLRKALGAYDCLRADDFTLGFDASAEYWLDARVIGQKTNAGASADDLIQMVSVYEGELLPGFYDDWVMLERERLQAAYEAKMALLMEQLVVAGRWEEVLDWGERWIALGRTPEPAYRALIVAHGTRGDAASAALAYRRCVEALRTELGVDPSPQTRAAYERWLTGGLPPAVADLPVRALRGYELQERIGAGAFGVVYRAYQPEVERRVAIKVIAPKHANQPDFIRRFEAEARLVAQLEHPHIVPLYDYWREPGGAYLVMRWLPHSLRTLLAKAPLTPPAALELVEQIASALAAAHRQGIAHLDLKPDNILLDDDGNAYLADFGIARAIEEGCGGEQEGRRGSLDYISPEQIRGEAASVRTDLYGLGLVLYEMVAGRHPFPGSTPDDLIVRHLREPLPDLRGLRPDLPEGLNRVVQRATAKDPAERYSDVLLLVADLRRAVLGEAVGPVSAEVELPPLVNPYKGLRAFEEADAADFFGREALVKRLVARLSEPDPLARFLAVVGASGCGKSSLAKAGLIPALRRGAVAGSAQWFIVTLTPGEQALKSLETALLRVAVRPPAFLLEQLQTNARGLLWAADTVLAGVDGDLLLVIDQFEELFTLATSEIERAQFLHLLHAAAADARGRVRVVVTLRADFTDRPLQYPEFGELMRQRTEFVLPLTADELGRAVTGPAGRVGVSVDNDLLTALVADVREEPGALPMLQYALTETFERCGDRRLTLEAYHDVGGVSGALARRADEVYAALDAAGQAAARQLFLRLVTLGEGVEDTRRRVLSSELMAVAGPTLTLGPSARPADAGMRPVLDTFGQARLLTFDRDAATHRPTVEVAHEALLREWARLRGWLDESRGDIRLQRALAQAAAEWEAAGREDSYLLSGARLAQFEAWAATASVALTPGERAFYEASLAERDRRSKVEQERKARLAALEKRTRQVLQVLAGVFLVAAIGAGGLAWWANTQRQAATAARQEVVANLAVSNALRLAAEAKTLVLEGRDAPTAALLALRSIGLSYTPQGDEILSQALQLDYPLHAYTGHVSQLWNGGFLPGDQAIFTSSSDNQGSVRIWDVATGQVLRSFDVEKGCLTAKLSPDGKNLAAACLDGLAHVWNLETGQEVGRFRHQASENPRVRFSPDSKMLVTCGVDAAAMLWDLDSGRLIREFAPTDSDMTSVMDAAFFPGGQWLATGGEDGIIRLWDVATGAQVREFAGGHTDWAWAVDVSPDGKYLVSSSLDSTARLWDVATGREVRRFVQGGGMSYEVAFSPDGRYVLTGGWDNTARVWDAQTGREVRRFTHPQAATGLAFSADGKFVLTTAWDQVARLWELRSDTGLPRYPTLESSTGNYGALSPDGRWLAVTMAGGGVGLLDAQTGEELRRFTGRAVTIWDIAFAPDGRYLAATSSVDSSTRLWDTHSGVALWTNLTAGGQSIAFSADGQQLFVVGRTAGLYEAVTGKLVRSFAYSENMLFGAYAPDGATVATTLAVREDVLLWDTTTAQVLRRFQPDPGDVMRALVYSPDGRYLAGGGNTGTLYLWDVATGQEVRRFIGHASTVERALAFSPDGRYLASGAYDRTVRIWEVATGQEIRRIAGYNDGVTKVAYTPDGRLLLTISYDGAVRMTYARLQDAIDDLCRRQLRDFLPDERERYNITDSGPTCPGLQSTASQQP